MSGERGRFAVLGLALMLGLITAMEGQWNQKYLLYLVVLVLVGSIFPPAGLAIGGIAMLRMLFVGPNAGKGAPFNLSITAAWEAVKGVLAPGGTQPQNQKGKTAQ